MPEVWGDHTYKGTVHPVWHWAIKREGIEIIDAYCAWKLNQSNNMFNFIDFCTNHDIGHRNLNTYYEMFKEGNIEEILILEGL